MSVSYKFAIEQADAAAKAADEAVLANVRERALRSETAWRTMASQAFKTEETRRRREETAASARDEA
ncbi:MAG: hypothetical protein VYD90_07150 [Pseudomonadota bacterium]|nr:hypothetical protein [Pseudomonadota bacterium]